MNNRRLLLCLGLLAIAFYATHGLYQWSRGVPEKVLWACHLGALAVGLGLVVRSRSLTGMGLLWLCVGTPLWLVGLLRGASFLPTSVLTHVGVLAIGAAGLQVLGWPRRRVWWKALVALAAVHFGSRWFGPPGTNVNLAGWRGWEAYFPSQTLFIAVLLLAFGGVFLALEYGLRLAASGGLETAVAALTGSSRPRSAARSSPASPGRPPGYPSSRR
jgi:hypothetical protein